MISNRITSPDHPCMDELCQQLAKLAPTLTSDDSWPQIQLQKCGDLGVFEWFLSANVGGQGWSERDVLQGYLRLSEACLTTTFIITQRTGACKRIGLTQNQPLRERLLPDLVTGTSFSTLAISHLTTSRRHLGKPALLAQESPTGFVLNGYSPWVTGATFADHLVVGATLDDNREILLVVMTGLPGVSIPKSQRLVALTASQTGQVHFKNVSVGREWLLAGPMEDIMQQGGGGATGGLQTSTLAIGLAQAAVRYLQDQAKRRCELREPTDRLNQEWNDLRDDLLAVADGQNVCSKEDIRSRANSLVLRGTQAGLAAAKGTGYSYDHPVGRWCCEALFFLVWSCPQTVMAANMCELAGMTD